MQITRILAIRHGETEWNVGGRLQGHLDIPLNDTGRLQAERLARALAGREPIHAIYSSDLSRARGTALALADAVGVPVITRPGLRERSFGDFQGQTFEQVRQAWPDEAQRWRRRDPEWAPPRGESLLIFQERVAQELQALAAENTGNLIVIVTHGGVLDVLYRAAARLGLQDARTWELANTAVNRLLWSPDGGLSLVGWADVSHLEEDMSLDENTS
mgnify:CR=1 FL=1